MSRDAARLLEAEVQADEQSAREQLLLSMMRGESTEVHVYVCMYSACVRVRARG
jgi:hypothetical protein